MKKYSILYSKDCKIEKGPIQFPDCAYLRIRAPIPFIFQGFSHGGQNQQNENNLK